MWQLSTPVGLYSSASNRLENQPLGAHRPTRSRAPSSGAREARAARPSRPAPLAGFNFLLEMPKEGEMTHISRPFQIALLAVGVLMAVWFVALRGHSGSSAPPSPGGSPAAATSNPAAAPSSVYHGGAPGVEGLTHAIAKAHGAVTTSQQNAKALEEKSAQASGGSPASGASSATSSPQSRPSTIHTGSAAGSAHSAPATKSVTPAAHTPAGKAAGSLIGVHRIPARQALVERALKEGKIAVILFWNPKGADDVAVHLELRLLEAVHHLIRPLANVPRVRRELQQYGLELQKRFAAFEARGNQVTSFGSITHGVQVYGTPTLMVINKRGEVKTLTGLTDAYAIEQTIDEARHS
jgi:hypothetical protein